MMKKREPGSGSKFFVLVLVTTILFAQAAMAMEQACSPSITDPTAIDRLIDRYVNQGGFPGIYVRLEDANGDVIYEHGAVNEEVMPGISLDGQTWFRIWSMSKIITISTVLDLVEDGIVALKDPVAQYIPEFAGLQVAVAPGGESLSEIADKAAACPLRLVPATKQMTLLDLINHQAGFYYATTGISCLDEPLARADLPAANSSEDFVHRLSALPLIQQPGSNDFYGTNTTVLGIVAERATGKSLHQLVQERVTGPLNIQGLQYGLPAHTTLLPVISGQDGPLRPARPGELDIFGPSVPDYNPGRLLYLGGEGMLATADGYADFLRMLLRRGDLNGYRMLNESTVADITAPHTQLDNDFGYNGYNLWVNNGRLSDGSQGTGGLWIGGGYEGTHFWIDPARKFVGLIMSQIFWVPESGWGRDEVIREAVYEQIATSENTDTHCGQTSAR
jgi:CubicO group peptidase (beta-lactamase class C family)